MPAAMHDRCYWTDTARAAREFPRLQGEITVDVAIVGGGIVGTAAARCLKDRGLTVALVEAGRVGEGVTGRSTAKVTAQHGVALQRLTSQHGEEAGRAYAAANREGVATARDLAARFAIECDLEEVDSLIYATSAEGAERLRAEQDAAERAGLPMEWIDRPELPFPVVGALRLARQAQFQPVHFAVGLAATLSGGGSHVFENSRVTDWGADAVATGDGRVAARYVIMATHLPLGQVGLFYAHTHAHMHAVLAVPVSGARPPAAHFINADDPRRSLRWHRAGDGQCVLVLTGAHFKAGDREGERAAFAELEGFVRSHFGWTGGGWRWSNEDYAPRDGLPYVGWSGKEGGSPLVATGFDAWGLSNGMAAAHVLADLVEGRHNDWAALFDASRHSLKGLGQFARDQAEVARDFVSGHLDRYPNASEADRLNEGDLVSADGRKAGVFRDERGRLRAVSATCTHMGCALGWNGVDRTWDCPCHGSRFAADGRVLHGPAVEPLEPVALPEEAEAAR